MGRGKRKGRSEVSETLISRVDDGRETAREEKGGGGGGFFACYLLTSLSPRYKGHTYIGYTVNPRRRVRQHNGEITSGAWRTKKKRPWEMVLCIYGFPTNVSALQFEWAWQHPRESLAVRKAAATFKTLGGIANKVKLAYTMLTLPAWQSLNLTVNFFSTKYTKHSAGCPTLPEHMKVQVCSIDELPCYLGNVHNDDDGDNDDLNDDEASNSYRYVNEGLTDTEVHSSLDHQKSSEEHTNEQNGSIEEIGMGPLRDSVMSGEDSRGPVCFSCFSDSPVQVSFVTKGFSASEYMESRDLLGLIEESDVELDQPIWKSTPMVIAPIEDQPFSKSFKVRREVEIIDVLSSSPSYRITRSHSKKRRIVSSVCPEIIDLTNSPIFV